MIEFTAHQLLFDALLVIVMLLALDWRESRWAPRAAVRERPRLRSMPRPATPRRDAASDEHAAPARRKAS
jgi:hypothetical protein